jgi:hypothetical protein
MRNNKPWTAEELKRARQIVGKHPTMNAACVELSQAFRKNVSQSTFRETCRRAGLGSPSAWLKEPDAPPSATAPPVDPVERVQAESKAARVVREHRDLAREVADLRAALEARSALASAPLPPIKRRELGSGLREGTFVAMASDWHVEERVRPGDTPTGNAYNLEIADLRIGRFFSGVEWLVGLHRDAFQLRDGILWLGGDLMSGHIHDENVETSAMPPIATLLWLQPRIVAGIRQLVDRCDLASLQVVCSYGNHGRDTKKPRRATGAHHSYEWGMYQQIAAVLADDPRIRMLADPSGHQYAKAYEFDLHFHHGDETNYQGGTGGITIPVNKAVAQWDRVRRCHYHHFGHWHQYVDLGNWAGNGSLIGYNAYAMAIKATFEPPQQAFHILDSKRGKCCRSPIWVGDASAERALWRDAA